MAGDERPPPKLHDGEADIDANLARRLVATRFPELRRVDPAGAPPAGRAPLRELDADTRAAIASARDVLDGDAATAAWERARGYALHQAALIIPYHAETNPGFVASARRTVDQVLADAGP